MKNYSDCALELLKELECKNVKMHGVMLYHKDKVILDHSYLPLKNTELHRLFSATKTLTAIAIGLLISNNTIGIDDKICDYFPEKLSDDTHPWIKAMTIRNLLMMRSAFSGTTYKGKGVTDWVGSFFTTEPNHIPGTVYHYDTSAPHVLTALVEKKSGKDLISFVRDALPALKLDPRGYGLTDPQGVVQGGTGYIGTINDLLAMGVLLLDARVMNQEAFTAKYASADYDMKCFKDYLIDASSILSPTLHKAKSRFETYGYGYYIWGTAHNGFMIYGMGGQFAAIYPDKELVLITTANTQGDGTANDVIFDSFYQHILNEDIDWSSADLVNDDNCPALSAFTFNPLDKGVNPKDCCKCLSADVLDNKMAFKHIELISDSEGGTLKLKREGFEDYELNFGLGCFKQGSFPVYKLNYLASGTWVDDHTLYILFNILDDYLGAVHISIYFTENGAVAHLRKVEESLFSEFDGHLITV